MIKPLQIVSQLDTISFIESESRTLEYEVGTIVSADGKIVKQYVGSGSLVRTPMRDLALFVGNVFTHNHPSGRGFTVSDVQSFALSGASEMRASLPDGTVFVLRRRASDVAESLGNILQNEVPEARYPGAAYALQEEISADGHDLSEEKRDSRIFDIMAESVHTWLVDNAEEFGYTYSKEE
ncbi:MAG: hypothetical protein LBN05_08680 [Oscillospiraceae bacterium]|jgi:hypothetical protein|nr:hypothetical protein [Oscillospiraceae bacterium]